MVPYLVVYHWRYFPACGIRVPDLKAAPRVGYVKIKQFQDYTPTPGTLSTAMYVTGLDRDTLQSIHVPRGDRERREQRQTLEKYLTRPRRR